MGVNRSDSCHKADPSFYTINKVSRILDALTVLMMSIEQRVNEAHHHDPILEASQEHLGDQVMWKMVSSWKHSGLYPTKILTYHTNEGIRCDEKESRVRSGIQHGTYVHDPQWEIFVPYMARCREFEERQQ